MLTSKLRHGCKCERGASAPEYALLVALVASVIIGIVTTIGLQLPGGFNTVINSLP